MLARLYYMKTKNQQQNVTLVGIEPGTSAIQG